MKTKPAQQNAVLPLSNIIHIDVFCQYIIIHCHTWWNKRNRLQTNCTGICFYTLFLWNGIIKTVIDLKLWLIVPTRCIKLGTRSYIFLFIWPLCLKELVKRKISEIYSSHILPWLPDMNGKCLEWFLIFSFFLCKYKILLLQSIAPISCLLRPLLHP